MGVHKSKKLDGPTLVDRPTQLFGYLLVVNIQIYETKQGDLLGLTPTPPLPPPDPTFPPRSLLADF